MPRSAGPPNAARSIGSMERESQSRATPPADSYQQFADGYYLRRDEMQWLWDRYIPQPDRRSEITAFPLRANTEERVGLPRALVITAEADVLRDEGEAYATKLRAAGGRGDLHGPDLRARDLHGEGHALGDAEVPALIEELNRARAHQPPSGYVFPPHLITKSTRRTAPCSTCSVATASTTSRSGIPEGTSGWRNRGPLASAGQFRRQASRRR